VQLAAPERAHHGALGLRVAEDTDEAGSGLGPRRGWRVACHPRALIGRYAGACKVGRDRRRAAR
jgi:hypothetical protein